MAQPDPKRSIKPWIPHRSTDETYYEFHAYPKMMTKLCTEQDLKDWMDSNNYIENGKVCYRGSRPVVGSPIGVLDATRQPVIVNSLEEEEAFLKLNPPGEQVTRVEVPAANLSSLTHAADIAAKEKEVAELKEKLAKAQRPIIKRKRHWAKKPSLPLPPSLPPVDSA